jgi:hypothetical protein
MSCGLSLLDAHWLPPRRAASDWLPAKVDAHWSVGLPLFDQSNERCLLPLLLASLPITLRATSTNHLRPSRLGL